MKKFLVEFVFTIHQSVRYFLSAINNAKCKPIYFFSRCCKCWLPEITLRLQYAKSDNF